MENNDWMTINKFYQKYQDIHASLPALRVEVAKRHLNGLHEAGVVKEKRINPDPNAKPRLLISPSRYYKFLGLS
jgi:hypothetical protein